MSADVIELDSRRLKPEPARPCLPCTLERITDAAEHLEGQLLVDGPYTVELLRTVAADLTAALVPAPETKP
jgi:hypothetical protein